MTVTELRPDGRRSSARFVLTGSRCYLADRLAEELLRHGERVVVLEPAGGAARPADGRLQVVEHEPEDPAVPADLGDDVDVVLHVAAGPDEESLRGLSGASLATLFALRLARANGARLVIASLPGNADHLHADEALAAGYRSSHAVDTVLARVAECYGPAMPGDLGGVVACLLRQAGESGSVVVSSDDPQGHSVCFVDDVVEGLIGLARGCAEGPVYLGPDREATTAELAREVALATGARYRVVTRRPSHAHAAPARALAGERPNGWRPRTALREGLRRCLPTTGEDVVVDLTAAARLRLVGDTPEPVTAAVPSLPAAVLRVAGAGGDVA